MGCGCGGAAANSTPIVNWLITKPNGDTYTIQGTEMDARVQRVRNGGGSFAQQK